MNKQLLTMAVKHNDTEMRRLEATGKHNEAAAIVEGRMQGIDAVLMAMEGKEQRLLIMANAKMVNGKVIPR